MEQVENTIESGLRGYSIGAKLRALRLRKSMGLAELSNHTGLSTALLSKLERDVMHPTLATLLRISMVFSVGLEYFFNPEPKPVREVIRKTDRMRFPDSPASKHPAYFFESLDFPVSNRALNSYLAEFTSTDLKDANPHTHPGVEFVFVLNGELELRFADTNLALSEGDAIYFDSSHPHAYRNLGPENARALVTTHENGR